MFVGVPKPYSLHKIRQGSSRTRRFIPTVQTRVMPPLSAAPFTTTALHPHSRPFPLTPYPCPTCLTYSSKNLSCSPRASAAAASSWRRAATSEAWLAWSSCGGKQGAGDRGEELRLSSWAAIYAWYERQAVDHSSPQMPILSTASALGV